MAVERVYNVPLRKDYLKVPLYRRAKKASNSLRSFIAKHMKVSEDNIKIGKYANLEIWKHGMRNPPHHIKVNVTKNDEGIVHVELVGAPVEKKAEAAKITVKEAKADKIIEADAKVVEEKKVDITEKTQSVTAKKPESKSAAKKTTVKKIAKVKEEKAPKNESVEKEAAEKASPLEEAAGADK